ncbi:PhzF family phenazine biosynthesis protein [Rouxiella sp. Mn2063]|uniref:PhzF family phenazine biosynthesis protein n=1 Tax=Rouxiella sp. Mn2063 TaxID=3395262 RepID=UPI003BC92240
MSVTRRFKQVDVFTPVALKGNPLAVIFDAEGLSSEQMQDIACWTNLSETTFILPPEDPRADYRVRIFTSDSELPFAGHPTLGTAHSLLESGLQPKTPGLLQQECGVGLVAVKIATDNSLAFSAPEAEILPLSAQQLGLLSEVLGAKAGLEMIAAQVVKMGICWLVVRLPDAQTCLDVQVDADALVRIKQACGVSGVAVFGVHPHAQPADYELRAFIVEQGVLIEDPVTGSANACLARLLQAENFPDGEKTRTGYQVRQGTQRQRAGQVNVEFIDGLPWIGGMSVTLIDGTITV